MLRSPVETSCGLTGFRGIRFYKHSHMEQERTWYCRRTRSITVDSVRCEIRQRHFCLFGLTLLRKSSALFDYSIELLLCFFQAFFRCFVMVYCVFSIDMS